MGQGNVVDRRRKKGCENPKTRQLVISDLGPFSEGLNWEAKGRGNSAARRRGDDVSRTGREV